jgi:hypothetical protein
MEDYVYLWLLWILLCLITFFMEQSKERSLYLIGCLITICVLPYQMNIHLFTIQITHIWVLLFSHLLLIGIQLKIRQYFYIILIAYIYTIYFLWYLTSPVFSHIAFLIFGIIGAILLLYWTGDTFHQKVRIWLSSIAIGQALYMCICASYYLESSYSYEYFYAFFTIVITILSIFEIWNVLLKKVEHYLQIIEAKKRCST